MRAETFETAMKQFQPAEIWVGQDGGIGAHVHKPDVRGDDVLWVCGGHRTNAKEKYFDSAGTQPLKRGEVAVCKVEEGTRSATSFPA